MIYATTIFTTGRAMETLTHDLVSFEQLGLAVLISDPKSYSKYLDLKRKTLECWITKAKCKNISVTITFLCF